MSKMTVEIENVSMDGLDIYTLSQPIEQSKDRVFKLVCSFNPFYQNVHSGMVHTKDSINRGPLYKFSDHDCLKVFNFLKRYFEHINEENKISIELDLEKLKIDSIKMKPKHKSGQWTAFNQK